MTEETKPEVPAIDPAEFAAMKASIEKLTANNQALKAEKAEAAKAAKEAAAAALAANEEAARKAGDVGALEKSWQAKLAAAEQASKDALAKAQSTIKDLTAGATARQLASELALPGFSDGLMPHINGRLTVEFGENGPVTRVLDKSGKPSAMTIDEFKAEIKATPYLASMLLGSQANGAGKPGGKGAADVTTMKRAAFDKLDSGAKREFSVKGGRLID